MNKKHNLPYIFVVGNEKGGAGKTTCTMHLISALLDKGHAIASIDTDSRQHSLTNYVRNREIYNQKNPDKTVPVPLHYHIEISNLLHQSEKDTEEKQRFEIILEEAKKKADYIVIDTPGSHCFLSNLAHSYADTVITPINDSFIDIDVMAKINPDDLSIVSPSIYSEMIWKQKMERATRDKGSIEWVVMRNRLSNLDAVNKRNVGVVLDNLAKRISFKVIPGFSERVIFRELFLQGLTLIDLTKANHEKVFNASCVAARQELRNFISSLGV
jgi:chromosome partitioning protein